MSHSEFGVSRTLQTAQDVEFIRWQTYVSSMGSMQNMLNGITPEYNLPNRGLNLGCQFIDKGIAMTDLHQMKCVACRAGEPTVTDSEIYMLHPQIPEWQVKEVDGMKRLEKVFKLKNFVQALEFTNKIGAIAEEENHHPLIVTEWGKVTVQRWTHKIGGLHKNDFIMAAKTDERNG